MKKSYFLLLVFSAFLMFTTDSPAQTKVRVKFAKGATSAALKGSITGYKYIDYIVAAKERAKDVGQLKNEQFGERLLYVLLGYEGS